MRRSAVIGAVVALVATGCGDDPARATRTATATATPTVTKHAVPKFPVAHFKTSGWYPQVIDAPAAVNRALTQLVAADQKAFAARARGRSGPGDGTYEIDPVAKLMSVGPQATSVMLPSLELFRGGNDGQGWISGTIAADGTPVTLDSLLGQPAAGRRALAKLAAQQVSARGITCARRALRDKVTGKIFRKDFADLTSFAVVRNGLALGYDNGNVAYSACGRISVILSAQAIDDLLSTQGRELIAAAKQPTITG